jgi:superfamily II DNA or RNA helicase
MSQLDFFDAPAAAPAPMLTPPAKPRGRTPRYYQLLADAACQSGWRENRSELVVMATGLGKTVFFATIAAAWQGRVLMVAHREELISQARATLEETTGEYVGTEKAEYRCGNERIVVTSVQTMSRRLEKFSPDHFSLIIIDEAHRTPAPSYIKILDYFTSAKVLGVTATPDRADEKAMGAVFDDVAFVMDITDGIEAGYLVPVHGEQVFVEEVDLSNVSTVSGDLAQGELDEEMLKATESVVQKTYELCGTEQVIIFTPGVRSAHAMAERMNAIAPGSAISIDGGTDSDERRMLVKGFKARQYQYLFNCAVATEGFDAPATSVVAIARPTKSRSLYAQMCGRGTRVLPGVVDHLEGEEKAAERRAAIAASKKPRMRVLDFVGNAGKHSLVGPVDVLGGDYTEEEVKAAKAKMRDEFAEGDGQARDVHKALKEARNELKALAARMQAAKAKVKAQVTSFDPFKCLGLEREQAISTRFGSLPVTEGQAGFLIRRGLKEADVMKMDKRTASKLIDKLNKRQDAGLATIKQLAVLSRFAPVPDSLTFQRASEACDYVISASKWKPNAERLHAILARK